MSSTWSKISNEWNDEQAKEKQKKPGEPAAWATLLKRKITGLVELTGRPLFIYGSACTVSGKRRSPAHLQIDASDKIGFHDILESLTGPNIDILIHSPGGSPEATETLVEEIRRKFDSVRFLVPAYAKSAATMMVMAGDEILIDQDAELGPIDPQMVTGSGVFPAEAVKEQFIKASEEIMGDPKRLSIWLPILQPMGPSLLIQCDNAIALSKELVTEWLSKYMYRDVADGRGKASQIAEYLGNHNNFKSHERRVKLDHLLQIEPGFKIRNIRDGTDLYPRLWELYCVIDLLFGNTPIYKLFFNSEGDAMVRFDSSSVPTIEVIPVKKPLKQERAS